MSRYGPAPSVIAHASDKHTFIGCHAYRSATPQTLVSSTVSPISFDAELYDTHAFHDLITEPTRLTIPTGMGGYYLITGVMCYTAAATGTREANVWKNASDHLAFASDPSPSTAGSSAIFVGCIANLAAGDYVRLIAWHTRGSNLDTQAASNRTSLALTYLGT